MSKEALDAWMAKYPRTHEFPEDTLPAVRATESSGDDYAVSKKGAIGPMQIVPKAHGLEPSDITDPAINLEVGARILDNLQGRFKDTTRALKAYNRGPDAERKHEDTPPKETTDYIARIAKWKQDHPVNADWTNDTTPLPPMPADMSRSAILKGVAKDTASNVESLARGAAAVIPGVAGDIEGLARKGINAAFGAGGVTVSEKPVLRTTEDWLKAYPQRFTDPTEQAAGMEQLGAGMNVAVGPGNVVKGAKLIAEAPGVRMGSKAAQRGILDIADKGEQLDYNRLARLGKTPEEIWKATQTMKTDEGYFKRVDDTKSSWTGDKAIRTARPDEAQAVDDAKEALRAHTQGALPKTKGAWDILDKVQAKQGTTTDYEQIIHDAEQAMHAPMTKAEGVPLNDVLHHAGLYYRHPELKGYTVRIGSQSELGPNVSGHHDVTNKEIVMNKAAWEDVNKSDYSRSLMQHEIQHAIDQARATAGERMTVGANLSDIQRKRTGPLAVSSGDAWRLYAADKGETRARHTQQTMDVTNKDAPYPMGDVTKPGTFDISMADQLGVGEGYTSTKIPPSPLTKAKFDPRSVPPDPKEVKALSAWLSAAPAGLSQARPAIPVRRGVWSVDEIKDVLQNPDNYDTSTMHDALDAIRWLKKNSPKP